MRYKFIVDANVGKLVKWLRIMGFDAIFAGDLDDDEIAEIAINEGRILLTRDTSFLRRKSVFSGELKVVYIIHDDVREQLRQVVRALDLLPQSRPFSLCICCNEELLPCAKEEVRELVPPYVYSTQENFMRCPRCGRIYWRGTHWHRMKEVISSLAQNE